MKVTELYSSILKSPAHTVVCQGGSSAGKTYAILQVLITIANNQPGATITIAAEDVPRLKVGALRDMQNILHENPLLNELVEGYNKSERVFTFRNGSIMEFNSYDDSGDARSGKRTHLFINEANSVPWEIYQQLSIRTSERVFIDFNADTPFWAHEYVIPSADLFIVDHRHNPHLPQRVRDKLEALKDIDKESWRVYSRGFTGKSEGVIFSNWSVCEGIDPDAKFVGVGLDFGYSQDPTSIVGVWKQEGMLWVKELVYETGLTNDMICQRLREHSIEPNYDIIADSAEPKSIQEIANNGFLIYPAQKGNDSIRAGINALKKYHIKVTSDSFNLRTEFSRYRWKTDKDGRMLNVPVDNWNHGIDALRYVALNKLMDESNGKYWFV